MKTKFCMSYSCGKDSTLALYKMVEQGNVPLALIVSVNQEQSESWFHGVGGEMLREVSESLNIPLLEARCTGETYETVFVETLKKAKQMGATACVFGDIDIDEHRKWCEDKCELAQIDAIFPLWQLNRLDVTNEFIDKGFKSCIKTVSKTYKMSTDYLGKTLTREIVEEIASQGLDPCGENGEYHTFCYDGVLFAKPIKFKIGEIHESEYSYSISLESVQ